MPSQNEIIIAAAGGGKTTRIVKRALADSRSRSALLTYTRNNVRELQRTIYELNASIPSNVEVWPWFSFLLRELARPYQLDLHNRRIEGICWVEGRSGHYEKQTDISRFYFSDEKLIYSDKLARFVCECNTASSGAVLRRLEHRFDCLYIDEVQDMIGYDIELIELILRSKVRLTLVGDHRQSTLRTHNAAKNSGYAGVHIIRKFKEWHSASLSTLRYERDTFRCQQTIANFADAFFPDEPHTNSYNVSVTGHDGVFVVERNLVREYMALYRPQVLRLDKRTACDGYEAMNFGESKGLSFDRVLIFPHKAGQRWLSTGDIKHVSDSAAKMYVGVTRARHSVAFVFDGSTKLAGVQKFVSSK